MVSNVKAKAGVLGMWAAGALACGFACAAWAQPTPRGACESALQALEEARNRDAVFKERFLAPLVQIEKTIMDSKTPEEAARRLTDADFRSFAFRLEYLFEIGADAKWGGDRFKSERRALKRLEDWLGLATDGGKFVKRAESFGIPYRALVFMKGQGAERRQALAKLLVDDGWFKTRKASRFEEYADFLEELDAPKQRDDSRYVASKIVAYATEIRNTEFDLKRLEGKGGFHDFRRKLRRLLIYIHQFRGLIQVVPDRRVPKSLEPFQELGEESKKYLAYERTDRDVKHPILFPNSHYLALSWFVEQCGRIKEYGETHHLLQKALVDSETYADAAAADLWLIPVLKTYVPGWKPFEAESEEIHTKFMRSKVLDHVIENMKRHAR